MNREPQAIRDTDAAGRIARIGLSWREPMPGLTDFLLRLGMGCVLMSLFLPFHAAMTGGRHGTISFLLALGLAIAVFAYAFSGPSVARAAVFRADGIVETPAGIPNADYLLQLGGTHRSVVNIEARPMPRPRRDADGMPPQELYLVRLVDYEGRTVVLSQNLPEPDALEVSTRLTRALETLRREQAQGGSASVPREVGSARAAIIE